MELGTSLGITSEYMAMGNFRAKMITMEGADEVAAVARQNFQEAGLVRVALVQGDFQQTLPTMFIIFFHT